MRKSSILFSTIFASLTLISCVKESNLPETPMVKSVIFNVGVAQDYSQNTFLDLRAEVKLSVSKVDFKFGDDVLLWDTVFTMRKINEYPNINTPTRISKAYKNIFESREYLRLTSIVTYKNNNQTSLSANVETIPSLITTKTFDVNL